MTSRARFGDNNPKAFALAHRRQQDGVNKNRITVCQDDHIVTYKTHGDLRYLLATLIGANGKLFSPFRQLLLDAREIFSFLKERLARVEEGSIPAASRYTFW